MADETGVPEESEASGAPDVFTSKKSSPEEPMREGEADIVEFVESLFTDADQGRNDQCDPQLWESDLRIFWGDQWIGNIPSYKPRIVVNEIKSLLLQELSDLTDSRITIYAQKNPGSTERDATVEQSIQTYWKNEFCDLTILFAALDAMIYPLGFLQTGWNPRAKQGQGEVIFKSRDPITVFPDPDAEDDDSMRFMIFEDILDVTQIRADFPETGKLVQPEAAFSTKIEQGKERGAPRAGSGYTGPLYTKTGIGAGVPGWKKARARVLTCTIEDDETIEEIREIGGQLRQLKVPKYPHKRFIMTANRRVLYNGDMPFHHAPILTRVMLQPSVHSYWPAASLVNEFGEIQSTANKMDSMVAENALRLNVGEVFADADSGLNPKTYGGIPGMVYLIKPGSKVNKVYPQPMPADMVQAGERFRGFIRSTLGYPLSRTGAGTHGNVAAELAETEISQAMGLTRLRGRLMYQSVQKAVQMIFARMAQFYSAPRHMPYVEDGNLKGIKWENIAQPEEYAIHVDDSTFQIRSKTMGQRLALTLAKLGKMPTGRLLKMLNIPDAEAIAKELMDELKLRALAQEKKRRGGQK